MGLSNGQLLMINNTDTDTTTNRYLTSLQENINLAVRKLAKTKSDKEANQLSKYIINMRALLASEKKKNRNPSLAKTGKWIKAKAVRIVGKTLQILK